MKYTTVILTIFAIALTGLIAMGSTALNSPSKGRDRNGLEKLWKEYESTVRSDNALKSMQLLEKIKTLAEESRADWDFYRAAEQYRMTGSRRDWKQGDSLRRAFHAEIDRYGEPFVSFFVMKDREDGLTEYISEHRDAMLKGHHTDFYSAAAPGGRIYTPVLMRGLRNDYEYALWYILLRSLSADTAVRESCVAMLREQLGSRYPDSQLLELECTAQEGTARAEELRKFEARHSGSAVALLAGQELLSLRFSALAEAHAGSEEYKAFREECAGFEKLRRSFKGDEAVIADCCTAAKDLIEEMDSRQINSYITDGTLTVIARNCREVDVVIKEESRNGRTVCKTTLTDSLRSYYAEDTLSCRLPAMDDGEYSLSCSSGNARSTASYSRYSISLSDCAGRDGHRIYAADAESGRPIASATLRLLEGDAQAVAQAEELDFGRGYLELPHIISSHINTDRRQRLQCTYTDSAGLYHCSEPLWLYDAGESDAQVMDRAVSCQLLTDRAAFIPGDTLRFKAVLFHPDSMKTLPEGQMVTVSLSDAEGTVIGAQTLSTNDFGSVAGEFAIGQTGRRGIWRISVKHGGKVIESLHIRVDEFVLPTFDMTFEPDSILHIPGDEITVKGKLTSYSGHSLSDAHVSYTISSAGRVQADGMAEAAEDGSFAISFSSSEKSEEYFTISVKVTDQTGETQSWSTSRRTYRSIPFGMSVLNEAAGSVNIPSRTTRYIPRCIISDDELKIRLDMRDYWHGAEELTRDGLKVSYRLTHDGVEVRSGEAHPGEELSIGLCGMASGLYLLKAECTLEGTDMKSSREQSVLLLRDSDTAIDADIENVFMVLDGEEKGLLTGSTSGETWMNIDVYGSGDVLLEHKFVRLSGIRGQEGSLQKVVLDFKKDWPDEVEVKVLYFKHYDCHTYSYKFKRGEPREELPLAFTRFEDRTVPGRAYSFGISTLPGVECAATVFDKSTETIAPNIWERIHALQPDLPEVSVSYECGRNSSSMLLYRMGNMKLMESNAAMSIVAEADDTYFSMDASPDMPAVREHFANTLAFEPYLRSDDSGRMELKFTNSGKLSTYYVQLWAHDRDMHNSALRKEMTVTIPVKVDLVQPQYLYTGDIYVLRATVSSTVPGPVSGRLKAEWLDGSTVIGGAEKDVTLEGTGSAGHDFLIEVPAVKELGVRLSFISASDEHGSDAVLARIPVFTAAQKITETHSSLLHAGDSKETVIGTLRAQFVNGSGADAAVREISILDMVREAVPSRVEPASQNVLDLTEALFVRGLSIAAGGTMVTGGTPEEKLAEMIMSCRNPDGGFAWFAGMPSSPAVTATLLARFASLKQHGVTQGALAMIINDDLIPRAVAYLDRSYFSDRKLPSWCGGLTFGQYVWVRSLYAAVPLEISSLDREQLKSFRKSVKGYLLPGKDQDLNGVLLGKARRMRVIYELLESEGGDALAGNWGIKILSKSRLSRALKTDFESLMEYAVEHSSGGWYFPNAVMPARGLMESEAEAHVLICRLIEDCGKLFGYEGPAAQPEVIADGMRLWLMVQKETQKWDESPAFAEALELVMEGSEELLSAEVISLSKSMELPFEEVKKTGNGMKVERTLSVKRIRDGREIYEALSDGVELKLGDVVKAEYHVWSEENRSFVKLSAPRPASLRPVQQLSGHMGWWLSPLRAYGSLMVSPSGYRSVLKERTEYWMEVCPEESMTISEEFYVTQSGEFQMPAPEVECLYAPHYRAIDSPSPVLPSSTL